MAIHPFALIVAASIAFYPVAIVGGLVMTALGY